MHVLALTSISMLYVAPRPTHAQDCASGSALSLPRCERAGPRRGAGELPRKTRSYPFGLQNLQAAFGR